MKRRTFFSQDIQVRTEEVEGKKILIGLLPYNSQGQSASGRYKEVITDSAFTRGLKEKRRAVALRNHNDDWPLGSTDSGTLTLSSNTKGLECRCVLPDTSYAQDLLRLIERGDSCGMSFGFLPVKEDEIDGVVYLRDVDLFEVSFGVTFPFYPEARATVDVRSAAEELRHLIYKRGGQMDDETLGALKAVVAEGAKIIASEEAKRAEASQEEPEKEEEEKKNEEKEKQEEEERQTKEAALLKKRNAQRLALLAL